MPHQYYYGENPCSPFLWVKWHPKTLSYDDQVRSWRVCDIPRDKPSPLSTNTHAMNSSKEPNVTRLI